MAKLGAKLAPALNAAEQRFEAVRCSRGQPGTSDRLPHHSVNHEPKRWRQVCAALRDDYSAMRGFTV